MASLVYLAPDGQRTLLPLKPGLNRIGRLEGNDILVPDPSVEENHCEVIVVGGAVTVRHLGGGSGTTINNSVVQEGPLLAGESLRVGNVEFLLQDDFGSAAQPMSPMDMPPVVASEACRNHPDAPAKWRCTKCTQQFCDTCVLEGRQFGVAGVKFCPLCKSQAATIGAAPTGSARGRDDMTFASEMLAAWAYPFRGNGTIILLTGTIFFAIAGFAQRYALLLGGFVFLMTTGYWMAYAQKVVCSSANGEAEPPTWPDFSDFYNDIFVPFFHGVALFAVYLLPAWIALVFLPEKETTTYVIAGGLLMVGLLMMPMAWLAISMHDTVVGVSPHVVIPSIMRIPGHYMIIVVELMVLVAINIGLDFALEKLNIPFLGSLLSSFFGIYVWLVICRLLGSLYFLKRNRLGWF